METRPFDLDYIDPHPRVGSVVEGDYRVGDFGWAQRRFCAEVERQYNVGRPVRIMVLKARQLGISTATEGILFWWTFIHPGTNGLVMTHEAKQSMELFNMTKLFWDTWPYRDSFHLKYATKQHLMWEETRSQLAIATAKNVAGGRGGTYHAVHASEAAFYDHPEKLFTGLNQTIPNQHGTIVIKESTANGVGNFFYDEWQQAKSGEIDYVPLFFPWWEHYEYRMHTTLSGRSELDPDERQLLRMGATYEHIAWRRWAIPNLAHGDMQEFMQEYPATDEEAFIVSGSPIFSHLHLRKCYQPLEGYVGFLRDLPNGRVGWVADPKRELTVFKAPRKGDTRDDRYFVSGDPSETVDGDPACIQVINRETLEQVAVWHGRCDPVTFAEEMMKIGKFYNWAMLCPEVEGGGQATIGAIMERGYPNIWIDKRPDRINRSFNVFGWSTNYQRKRWCIGFLQSLVLDGSIIIHDRLTYEQMRTYVRHDNGDWGNSDGKSHDDSVMALGIGVTASDVEGPFTADQTKSNVYLDIYRQEFDDGYGMVTA